MLKLYSYLLCDHTAFLESTRERFFFNNSTTWERRELPKALLLLNGWIPLANSKSMIDTLLGVSEPNFRTHAQIYLEFFKNTIWYFIHFEVWGDHTR